MPALTREQIAARIAQELRDGYYVNLGIGIPTLVSNYIPKGMSVVLQSENGILGMGPYPSESEIDADLINAGKETVPMIKGAAIMSSAESFSMIRAGKVDLTVLGAMEVDETGSIANWMIPGKMVKGMGGAMDLVASAKRVIVAMQHVDKSGAHKLLKKCDLPLTGLHCVDQIVSDYGVIEVTSRGFRLIERAPDLSVEQIVKATGAPLEIAPNVKPMNF